MPSIVFSNPNEPLPSAMGSSNHLNVYKGADSLAQYFDPDAQPPLPLVELPDSLNPLRGDGVRIYAKLMTALPAQNVKALPALNMLRKNLTGTKRSIVEPSSGSTVISLSLAARALYGIDDTCAFVSNKTEQSRLRTLQFFGLKVQLYGGPAQPEIGDPRGIIQRVKRMAEDDDEVFNPGQYESLDNPESHIKWTGPQLLKQLPEIQVFAAGMGSGGCITGTGTYLKQHKPSVTVVGVCNETGDSIPGPRPFPLFETAPFPWKAVTDAVEKIGSVESYRQSMLLSRVGLICGPSSGMALQGLIRYLQGRKAAGSLAELADETGTISCVFPCCDLPYQYMDGYFKRLGESDFGQILDKHLLSIDNDMYDNRWEVDSHDAMKSLYGRTWANIVGAPGEHAGMAAELRMSPALRVLDLRNERDYASDGLPGAVNIPLSTLTSETSSPFEDVGVLEAQWKELKELAANMSGGHGLIPQCSPVLEGPLVVLCYDGETARLATSVLRADGVEAYSVRGGMEAILEASGEQRQKPDLPTAVASI